MTLQEVYNLRAQGEGGWLRNRAIASVGKLAQYLANKGDATADELAFAARVLPGTNSEIEVDYILWALCFHGDVQAAGEAITDDSLNSVVENTLRSLGRVKLI